MANVAPVSVFATGDGIYTVTVVGLDRLLGAFHTLAPTIEKEVKRQIGQAGRRVLQDTKSAAGAFRDTGQFMNSFSMRDIKAGVRIQSNDPGAGAIEFANPGAIYLRGKRYGRSFPAVHYGKPRALVRASVDDEPWVLDRIAEAIQNAIDSVQGA